VGEALQDYNLVFILKKEVDVPKKMFIKTKKSETQTTMSELKKKITINNKTMQTQQHGE
jgi:hypothetical protein